jgi:hypothetical protein
LSFFRRIRPEDLVPLHPDNVRKKDWIVLLEGSTIVGSPRDKLRVALTTLERKIVKKYRFSRKAQHFIVVEGYDPRIHVLYFCPQLYRYDDDKLVPLGGDDIGRLIARATEGGAQDRQPWYEPLDKLPAEPIISAGMQTEFDSVVVDIPRARTPSTAGSK